MAQSKLKVGPPAPQILETELGEEISLYDPTTENVVVLNTTASDIWRLSDGESSLDEMVRLLAAAYGVNAEQIRPEVERVIGEFQDQGLLSVNK